MSETRDYTPESAILPTQQKTPESPWLVEGVDFIPSNSFKTRDQIQTQSAELAARLQPLSNVFDKGDSLG